MTANQLKYLEIQEIERANRAREEETARANRMQEELTRFRDTHQSMYWSAMASETERSNRAREEENLRSNLQRESLARLTLQEEIRANQAREAETYRHNVSTEGISRFSAESQRIQAYASQTQAAASWKQAQVSEYNAQTNRLVGFANLSETRRHNLAFEMNEADKLSEVERSNLEKERQNQLKLDNEYEIRNKELDLGYTKAAYDQYWKEQEFLLKGAQVVVPLLGKLGGK